MALTGGAIWEVQSGGDDSLNAGYYSAAGSGAGTDYSILSPLTCGDLAIDATTNTKVSSSAIGFTSAHQRNGLRITAGTGFTTGLFEITSVTAGVATLDRSAGTLSSTNGTARVGGALASPGGVMALKTNAVDGLIYMLNSGSTVYTMSGSNNTAGGPVNSSGSAIEEWVGYASSRTLTNTDTGPTIRAGANSITLFTLGGAAQALHNVTLDNPAAHTSATGVYFVGSTGFGRRVTVSAMTTYGIRVGVNTTLFDCTVLSQGGTAAFNLEGGSVTVVRCSAQGGTVPGFATAVASTFVDCVAYGMAHNGFQQSGSALTVFYRCTAGGTTGANGIGFNLSATGRTLRCLTYNNSQHDFTSSTATDLRQVLIDSFGSANNGYPATSVAGFTTLTANPWTTPGSNDFSLNTTAGGGAAVRGVAFAYPGLSTTSYADGGAVQHVDSVAAVYVISQNVYQVLPNDYEV